MKPRILTAVIVALVVGTLTAVAGVVGPMYMDSATGQAFPAQVPPTRIVLPNATKTLTVSATNTITTTDIATVTPSPSAIPMSGTDNRLDPGWLPGSTVYGSGTADYLAKFGAGGTTLTNSTVFDTAGIVSVRKYAGVGSILQLANFNNAPPYTSEFRTSTTRGTGFGAYAATQVNDVIGRISFQGSTASTFVNGAIIEAKQSGAVGTYAPVSLRMSSFSSTAENVDQLVLLSNGNVTSTGKVGAANTIVLPNATKTLLTTATLTITQTDLGTVTPSASAIPMAGTNSRIDVGWLPTGTNSSTVARGDDGTSAHSMTVQGNAWFKTGTGTDTQGTVSLNQDATLVVSQTTTSTATATATVTSTISASPGLNLTTGTNTVTMTTAQINDNPRINLSAELHCSGCVLSGTGTGTATSMELSQSPEIIVTPESVGALPASSVSGTQNYLAKFGATGATVGNSRISEPASTGRIDILLDASATGVSMVNLSELGTAFLGVYPGIAYDGIGTQHGIMSRSAIAGGIAHGGLVWRRFGAVWETALDFYTHPSGTGDVDEITRALSLSQAQAYVLGQVSTPSVALRGSTSGTATIAAPAAAGTTTWTLPASNCSTSQALNFSDGSGTFQCYTPMIADGSTGTGCTTISSTGGKVTACDTTAHVPASRTITFPYSTKTLTANITATVTDLSTSTAGNTNSIPNSGATGYLNSWVTNTTHTTDTRLSNARTPTAHASTHAGGGTDVIPNAVSLGNAGLLSGYDKYMLDQFGGMSNADPRGAGFADASQGTSSRSSRQDHRHPDTVDVSWTASGIFSAYTNSAQFGLSDSIVWEHAVFWSRVPTAAAAYVSVQFYNNSGATRTCAFYLYSSATPGSLGAAILSQSFNVTAGNGLYETAATFTKPASNMRMLQIYGSCPASTGVYIQSVHIHITAGS